jgi:hypothetical protein
VTLCQTIPVMADQKLVILRYQDKVPMMAGCAKCQRKFFALSTYYRDALGAATCLLGKFDLHECIGELKRRALY